MLRSGRRRRLVLIALAATLLRGARASDLKLPDPATGSIHGRAAILYWPALSTDAPTEPALLPPDGCRVHLIARDDPSIEHLFPCGKWFQPATGMYNAWLETPDRISGVWAVRYGGEPAKGGLAAITPVWPAGRVAIPAGRSLPEGEELRVLSLDGHKTASSGRIFERRVSRSDATTPFLMPAGRIVVGRFDKKSGDAIALSRPVQVDAGRTVHVWPEPPKNASDLLVVLRKPGRTGESSTTRLEIDDGNTRHATSVILDINRVIAIWYGLGTRSGTVSMRADKMHWPGQDVRLTPGRVTTIRAQAGRLPKLGVSLTVPEDAVLPDVLSITVTRMRDDKALAESPIIPEEPREFIDLPAELHRVTLKIGEWRFEKEADLTDGDGNVVFELEQITIAGTVFLGSDPVSAELRFHNRGRWVNVPTDNAGAYHATLWHAGYYTIRIAIDGSERVPFTQHFVPIDESGTRDFRIPLTNYSLSVRDEETSTPIADAKVNIGNVWRDESDVEQSLLDSTITDGSGMTILPPLRSGRLHLTVTAKGYGEAQLEQAVSPGDHEPHQLTIALRKVRSSKRLMLRSTQGDALAGAEIWAFREDHFEAPVWQATTSAEGLVDVPDHVGCGVSHSSPKHREPRASVDRRKRRRHRMAPRVSRPAAECSHHAVRRRSGAIRARRTMAPRRTSDRGPSRVFDMVFSHGRSARSLDGPKPATQSDATARPTAGLVVEHHFPGIRRNGDDRSVSVGVSCTTPNDRVNAIDIPPGEMMF